MTFISADRRGAVEVTLQGPIKGFVIPTKSFVKIGMTKIFCYNKKMFSSVNKLLVAAATKIHLFSLILLP